MKHLPNIFTSFRILCSPLILILLYLIGNKSENYLNLALWNFWIYVFAASTDWFDGFLARALDAKSELGAKLDLLADKLIVGFSIFGLIIYKLLSDANANKYSIIFIGILLLLGTSGRDYYITKLRQKGDKIGFSMPATFAAKSKTAIIMTGLGMIFGAIAFEINIIRTIGSSILFLGVALSIWTGLGYYNAFQKANNIIEEAN